MVLKKCGFEGGNIKNNFKYSRTDHKDKCPVAEN